MNFIIRQSRKAIRYYLLNFYATCGEVVHHRVHYLFGCGYAALGGGSS
jgi:hypothetical protein